MKSSKHKTLTRTTTCAPIFDNNESECCCDYCKKQVESLSHSRKNRKLSNKRKHHANRRSQPWTAQCATSRKSAVKALHHIEVCDCLNIKTSVAIEDECKYEKQGCSSSSSISQSESSLQSSKEKKTKGETPTTKNHLHHRNQNQHQNQVRENPKEKPYSKKSFSSKSTHSSKMALSPSDLVVLLRNGLPQGIDAAQSK